MFPKSHRQPQCTFATPVRRWRVVHLSWSSAFHNAGSSIQNASQQFVSCIHIYLVNPIFIQLHKQESNWVMSVNSNSCISVTIQPIRHMFIQTFFSQRQLLSTPKLLTLPTKSPCRIVVDTYVNIKFLTTANYFQTQNYWLLLLNHRVEYWLIYPLSNSAMM
jgi:hypothetical protein